MLDAGETVKPPGDPTCLRMAGMFMEEAWRCTLWAAGVWIKSTNHKWKIVPTHSPIKSSSAYLFHLLLDFSVSTSADVWTTKFACIGFPAMNSLESKSRPIIPYLGDEHPQLPANLRWKPTNSMGFDSHPTFFHLPGAGLDVPAQCKTLKYWLSAYLASRQHATLQTWWIPSIMDINRDVIGIWWDKCVYIYIYKPCNLGLSKNGLTVFSRVNSGKFWDFPRDFGVLKMPIQMDMKNLSHEFERKS